VGNEANFQLQEEYTRWEAVSPGSAEKIPMFHADFPGFTRKIVEHSPYLLQSSRASDGTPIHIRMDGPGFDSLDVPDGSNQPKLQFTIFVPTADFFATMRANQAALKFQTFEQGLGGSATGTVDSDDNGLERFLTATRRQNFLVPPRSRRTFPLREFLP
jgi:hypothetical protein